MSERRQVWAALASLLQKVEQDAPPPPADGSALAALEQEVRKLGKTQFKANALAEEQAARWEKMLEAAQAAQDQQARLLDTLAAERAAAARQTLLEATLPALDGLDNAIRSGRQYLHIRDTAATKPDLTPAQARLVSPADRAMLAGWLDGLRLVRARLLAILEVGDVTPIPTIGQLFDPYLHVAVGTVSEIPPRLEPVPFRSSSIETNLIVAEERPGYRSPAGVLRFAEVIVYRPKITGE